MSAFILSCESTADLPYNYVKERNIEVLFYTYSLDGRICIDDMGRNPDNLRDFYAEIDSGKMPKTSQINEYMYEDYFRELLKKGDVIHICFGSGMTPSYNNALIAAQKLREEFRDRQLFIVDSLCSSGGYGLLVDIAADMRDDGAAMEDIVARVTYFSTRIHHQFFSTDMTMFKRSGRVSGSKALVAGILGICPIMHLDGAGRIVALTERRMAERMPKKKPFPRCLSMPKTVRIIRENVLLPIPHVWICAMKR